MTISSKAGSSRRLPSKALLVKIDRFVFTADNITYAILGDRLKYWQMFPAVERVHQDTPAGRIPPDQGHMLSFLA